MLSLQSPSQLVSILGLDLEKVRALVKDKIIPIVEHSQNATRTLVVAELSDIVEKNIRRYPAEKIITEARPKSFYNIRVFMDRARDKHQLDVTAEDMKALASSRYATLEDVTIYDRINRYLVIPDEQAAVDFLAEREFDRDENLVMAFTHINIGVLPLIPKRLFIKLLRRGDLDRTEIIKDTAYRRRLIQDIKDVGNILVYDPSLKRQKIVLYSRRSAKEALIERHKGERTGAAKIIEEFFDEAANNWYFLPEEIEKIDTELSKRAQVLKDLAVARERERVTGGINTAILDEEFFEDAIYTLEKVTARLVAEEILMNIGGNPLSKPGPALTAELEYNPSIQLSSQRNRPALVKIERKEGNSYQLRGSWFFHYKRFLKEHNLSLPDRDYQIQIQTLSELLKYVVRVKPDLSYEDARKALLTRKDFAIDSNYLAALLGMKRNFIKGVQEQTISLDTDSFVFQFIRTMKIPPEEKETDIFSLNKALQTLREENPKFDHGDILNKIIAILTAFGPIPDYLVYEQVTGKRCEYIRPLPEATRTEHYAAVVVDGTNNARQLIAFAGKIIPEYLRAHSARVIESQVDETKKIYYSINLEDTQEILVLAKSRERKI